MSFLLNWQNLMIFSFVFFIQILGMVFLPLFFKDFVKKNNLFLNLGYSWFFGNTIFLFFIFALFVFKKLDLINHLNFLVAFFILLALLFLILLKNRKKIKINISSLFFLGLILIFFAPLILESLTSFLLAWDGMAIWFLKAKALYFNQDILQFLKDENFYYSSQAYPLGIPLIINSYYRIINQINDQTVQFYFVWYYLNFVFLIFGFLNLFFEKYIAKFILLLVSLIFLISSNFIIYSHNGYVDFQLGFMFFVIFSLFYFFIFEKNNIKNSFLIIFGLGFLLMIKNEALPFSLVILFFLTIFWIKKKGFFDFFKKNLFYSFSFLPFIYWEIYRRVNQIPSFLDGNLFPKKENLTRVKIVFNYFFLEYFNTNKYGLCLIICLFLIIFFGGVIFSKKNFYKLLIFFMIFFLQIFSYFYVFIITPFPYIIQLESSLERIFLQFIPLIYFLTMMVVKEGLVFMKEKETS